MGVLCGGFAHIVLGLVSGEGALAGAHADGSLGHRVLGCVFSRWDTRREWFDRLAREDLGRRDRSRGERGSALRVVSWF